VISQLYYTNSDFSKKPGSHAKVFIKHKGYSLLGSKVSFYRKKKEKETEAQRD
jgi:hypothetical protein